jgi:hypothetical protein
MPSISLPTQVEIGTGKHQAVTTVTGSYEYMHESFENFSGLYASDSLPPKLSERVSELQGRVEDLEDRAQRGRKWIAHQDNPAKRARGEARLQEIGEELYRTYEELGRLPIAWPFPE